MKLGMMIGSRTLKVHLEGRGKKEKKKKGDSKNKEAVLKTWNFQYLASKIHNSALKVFVLFKYIKVQRRPYSITRQELKPTIRSPPVNF
jgi:hypothetical protein